MRWVPPVAAQGVKINGRGRADAPSPSGPAGKLDALTISPLGTDPSRSGRHIRAARRPRLRRGGVRPGPFSWLVSNRPFAGGNQAGAGDEARTHDPYLGSMVIY